MTSCCDLPPLARHRACGHRGLEGCGPRCGRYPLFFCIEGGNPTLICHASGFHPPDISIDLLKNGVVMPDARQTDPAFEQDWQFHLTKSVAFTPQSDEYVCEVTHMMKSKTYTWSKFSLDVLVSD
ncbi:beta-2-microglobulin-like [Osmerus eperlanus]|uniref:beta-2-microglobulin-like n=1 Tax=Osmerus eperlanus TaxID=29151 RepID=UPI002E115B30